MKKKRSYTNVLKEPLTEHTEPQGVMQLNYLSSQKKQLLTYLRLAKKPLGLLINFNQALLKDGITRIINTPIEDT